MGVMLVDEMRGAIADAARAARAVNPLAGSVTNGVTMEFVANAQLAVGGSAAMVYLPDEGEFLVDAGKAAYVNLGTLLPVYEKTVPAVARRAFETKTAWVLDPVGIGIGSLRTQLLEAVRAFKPSVVRGNASEIIALAGVWGVLGGAGEMARVRGVDTTDPVSAARGAAVAIARFTGGAVAISGEEDLVTDGDVVVYLRGGSPLMEKVTGFGCSLGGVMAVYAAVADPFVAAVAGAAHYDVAGARAAQRAGAPASFKTAFVDELYLASPDDVASCEMRIEEA